MMKAKIPKQKAFTSVCSVQHLRNKEFSMGFDLYFQVVHIPLWCKDEPPLWCKALEEEIDGRLGLTS